MTKSRFEDLEGNHRFIGMDLASGPDIGGVIVIDDPWPCARQESSAYPDIDQMLADVGPVTDAILDQKLKEWFERITPHVAKCFHSTMQLLLDDSHSFR